MEEQPIVYMHPLMLEATLFLNSFRSYSAKYDTVDPDLLKALAKLNKKIEGFLNRENMAMVQQNEDVKFPKTKTINSIKRTLHCDICLANLGQSVEAAAYHVTTHYKARKRRSHANLPNAAVAQTQAAAAGQVLPKQKLKENQTQNAAVGINKDINTNQTANQESQALRRTQRRERKEKKKELAQTIPNITLSKRVYDMFNADLLEFFNEKIRVGEKLKILPTYELLNQDLLKLIKDVFPTEHIRIYRFGSRVTGVANTSSDLDLYVDIGKSFKSYFDAKDSLQPAEVVKKVSNAMRKCKLWTKPFTIEKARVPIIRTMHLSSHVDLDIGFSNSLGYCNSKLLIYFYDLQPMARRMVIFIKLWLEKCGLVGAGLTSYGISLMVIFALQQWGFLPSVESLQKNLDTPLLVGPWYGNFVELKSTELKIPIIELTTKAYELHLHNFFVYYTKFDFANNAISPYLGTVVPTNQLESYMPERYHNYMSSKTSDKGNLQRGTQKMLIQDPLELNHNLTSYIGTSFMSKFKGMLQASAKASAAKLKDIEKEIN